MDLGILKSKIASNCHQLVSASDPRVAETVAIVNELIAKQYAKKPLKMAACCVTILTYQGKGGYKSSHTMTLTTRQTFGRSNRLTLDTFLIGMKLLGLSNGEIVVLPALNIEHTTYSSLSVLDMRRVGMRFMIQKDKRAVGRRVFKPRENITTKTSSDDCTDETIVLTDNS